MILVIDNYDSFTYNLVHLIAATLGIRDWNELQVRRNDQITLGEMEALNPSCIIISPGPATPDKAGICLELIKHLKARPRPLLGVCLGHQALAEAFGAKIIRNHPFHGKLSTITHQNTGLFHGLNQPLTVTRYHSLCVDKTTLCGEFVLDAITEHENSDDDIIMGIHHKTLPFYGVQFHPESIATQQGAQLIKNFFDKS